MISEIDEYLHEYKKSKDWIETYSVHFIDKKTKLFGFADINYLFDTAKRYAIDSLNIAKNLENIWIVSFM